MWPEYDGDTYIDDGLHYELSVKLKILVTESHEQHSVNGQWWWKGHVPKGIKIDNFYKE